MAHAEYEHIFNLSSADWVLSSVLADSLAEFYLCSNIVSYAERILGEVSVSNVGIKDCKHLSLCPIKHTDGTNYFLGLSCKSGNMSLGIHLRPVGHQTYLRTDHRVVSRYTPEAMDVGDIQDVAPSERHLLLALPVLSG
jgi:hypothetical protein